MAEVIIEGVFMGSNIKKSSFDGNEKTEVVLDIYQKDSQQAEKTVTLKTQDLEIKNVLDSDYDFGSLIRVKASVNAYKNKAYFRLLEVV